MSDYVGALALPVPVPTLVEGEVSTRAVGDPTLAVLGHFYATVLQAQCGDAWEALDPNKPEQPNAVDAGVSGANVVRAVFYHAPERGQFVEGRLPALFIYRTGRITQARFTADDTRRRNTIGVMWVPPVIEPHPQRHERETFFNAVAKAIEHATNFRRHPSWVLPTDMADADGLMLPVATSTSASTISGAGLTGTLATTTLDPARPVQITTSAAVGAYNITDPIEVTGTLDTGRTFTERVFLTDADGGEVVVLNFPLATVTSIAIPAQATTGGQFTFGFYDSPVVRLGSLVQVAANLREMRIGGVETRDLKVDRGTEKPVIYRGVEAQVEIAESIGTDLAEHGDYIDPDEAYSMEAYVFQGNFNTPQNPFNSFRL